MDDLLKPFLQKLIDYINSGDYWSVVVYLILIFGSFTLFGFLSAWGLSQVKKKKEINKLNIEAKDGLMKLLNQVQKSREDYYNNFLIAQTSVKKLIQYYQNNNINDAKSEWEYLKIFFLNDLLYFFEIYLEKNEIYIKGDKLKEHNFIVNEIFNIFNSSKIMLDTLNNETILKSINQKPFILEKKTLIPAFQYVKNHTHFWNIKIRKEMKQYKEQLHK